MTADAAGGRMSSLCVVVPSRGLDALLAACLRALESALRRLPEGLSCQVVVVDNASAVPYLVADLPSTDRIIRFDQHHSFAEGCNAGYAAMRSDAVVFLNNDVLIHPDALVGMVARLSEPRMGIVGTRLVFTDGSIQHCGVVMTDSGPWHRDRGLPSSLVSRAERPVQAVTAAAMLVRGAAFDQLGGFSTQYPFGSEDIDLCLRARQFGWAVSCEQSVDSLHFESTTPGRIERDAASREVFDRVWQSKHTIDEEDVVT